MKSPDKSLLWQRLHVRIYSSSPRALCWDENTPVAMVFGVAEGSGRAIFTSAEEIGIPAQPATTIQLKSRHKNILTEGIGIKNLFQWNGSRRSDLSHFVYIKCNEIGAVSFIQ